MVEMVIADGNRVAIFDYSQAAVFIAQPAPAIGDAAPVLNLSQFSGIKQIRHLVSVEASQPERAARAIGEPDARVADGQVHGAVADPRAKSMEGAILNRRRRRQPSSELQLGAFGCIPEVRF